MSRLALVTHMHRVMVDRIRSEEKDIDEQTLADTVEGLTDLHEIVAAIVRSAVFDEALASGLKLRIKEMQERLNRIEDRAEQRREISRLAMIEAQIMKITASDLTISLRPGTPALVVIDEKAIPKIYWEPQPSRLKRQELIAGIKLNGKIQGAELSNPELVLSVRRK